MSSPTESRSARLRPEALLEQIKLRLPRPAHYWVGFSGGLDSSVLLNLFAGLRESLDVPLSAIHIDHGLQAGSADWSAHCQAECVRLGVTLHTRLVDATPGQGESPEDAARTARYQAIADLIGPRGMLLTAHHRDDQAETLLLQLLRGAGVDGLAAMPVVREWSQGWHARPLLGVRRQAIRDWAVANRVQWIDDPSNAVSTADRNYLRHQVMPHLVSRWPGAVANIARSAAHCADAADLIRIQAKRDLGLASIDDRLKISTLSDLPLVRARSVLRYWLRERKAPPLPLRRLGEALDQLCHARSDGAVRIVWHGVELRRFRGEIWLLREQRDVVVPKTVDWVGEEMRLGPGLGRVRRKIAKGGIALESWAQGRVQIGYRDAAKRYRPAGRIGSRTFKKLAQEFAVPPWQRGIIPVLLIDSHPAAVANCCICEPFATNNGETGWAIEWDPD